MNDRLGQITVLARTKKPRLRESSRCGFFTYTACGLGNWSMYRVSPKISLTNYISNILRQENVRTAFLCYRPWLVDSRFNPPSDIFSPLKARYASIVSSVVGKICIPNLSTEPLFLKRNELLSCTTCFHTRTLHCWTRQQFLHYPSFLHLKPALALTPAVSS